MDLITNPYSTLDESPQLLPSVQRCPIQARMAVPQAGVWITTDEPLHAEEISTPPKELRVSVIVPVYNEHATLSEIIRQIRAVPVAKEIILVDDASNDGTRELLATFEPAEDLRIILHERNRGKGAAVRTGFAQATGDIVIIQDADLEYDPRQYSRLIQPIVDGMADVVYGSRYLPVVPHRVLHFWHSMGNRALTTMSNMFTDLHLTDMETCYKVFRREVIEAIGPKLRENRFGIDPELTAKIARQKYRICEVGIGYSGRTYQEGKKIGLADACRVSWSILRYWWKDVINSGGESEVVEAVSTRHTTSGGNSGCPVGFSLGSRRRRCLPRSIRLVRSPCGARRVELPRQTSNRRN